MEREPGVSSLIPRCVMQHARSLCCKETAHSSLAFHTKWRQIFNCGVAPDALSETLTFVHLPVLCLVKRGKGRRKNVGRNIKKEKRLIRDNFQHNS